MKKTMSIIKEKRQGEIRVILRPKEVETIRQNGFEIYVETGAGSSVGFRDEDYAQSGARIVDTTEAWRRSCFIVKYKAPVKEEYRYLRPDMHLCALFHAEGDPELTSVLCKSGVTAYSYEFFRLEDGSFPIASAASEVAGKLAVLYGGYLLQHHLGGRGVLLPAVTGTKPCRVVIIGHGNLGGAAARLASQMGADVVVLGRTPERLRRFQMTVPNSVRCEISTAETVEREVRHADLVIGAILISTFDTEPIITAEMVQNMNPGSVIIDGTSGYGPGYIATFNRSTSLDTPYFIEHGVLHCKIDVLPASVPITTVEALSPLVMPYLLGLGQSIYEDYEDPVSSMGKITKHGRVVHPEVSRHMSNHLRNFKE